MNLKLYLITTLHLFHFKEPLLFKENFAHVSGGARFFNATFQVAACTVVGCGPLSQPVLIMPVSGKPDKELGNLLWWHFGLSSIYWTSNLDSFANFNAIFLFVCAFMFFLQC